jgi:hypothetical protein
VGTGLGAARGHGTERRPDVQTGGSCRINERAEQTSQTGCTEAGRCLVRVLISRNRQLQPFIEMSVDPFEKTVYLRAIARSAGTGE